MTELFNLFFNGEYSFTATTICLKKMHLLQSTAFFSTHLFFIQLLVFDSYDGFLDNYQTRLSRFVFLPNWVRGVEL